MKKWNSFIVKGLKKTNVFILTYFILILVEVSFISCQKNENTNLKNKVKQVPKINVQILGCDTGFDIMNQMGEVTNAYVTISNVGKIEIQNLCATLNALDEDRIHKDKRRCVDYLPPDHEVTLKLTVDTRFEINTALEMLITSRQDTLKIVNTSQCNTIDPNTLKNAIKVLEIVIPILL